MCLYMHLKSESKNTYSYPNSLFLIKLSHNTSLLQWVYIALCTATYHSQEHISPPSVSNFPTFPRFPRRWPPRRTTAGHRMTKTAADTRNTRWGLQCIWRKTAKVAARSYKVIWVAEWRWRGRRRTPGRHCTGTGSREYTRYCRCGQTASPDAHTDHQQSSSSVEA